MMDRLDTIAIFSAVVLLGAAALLALQEWGAGPAAGQAAGQAAQGMVRPAASPELAARIRTVKEVLAAGGLEGAEQQIQALIKDFPYEGEPRMMLADLLMRKQAPVEAMVAFRQAIELNPDFLDRKAPLFEGKKIKACVEEAKATIMAGLLREPDNPQLKEQRRTLYYMQRRIAGSCG